MGGGGSTANGIVNSNDISFTHLQTKYNNIHGTGSMQSPISLSEFRGAAFTNNTAVPSGDSAPISIDTHFRGLEFEAAAG